LESLRFANKGEIMNENRQVLVFGATGNMGGAAARELLRRGWQVRGVTRNLQSKKALALTKLGVEMAQANMTDRSSLAAAFAGMTRVFSVQNWLTSGVEGEIEQGKLVADVARTAGITHLVYGSAGIGVAGTGLPHFESKIEVEGYMRELGLPVTAVRPTPFMELMNQKEFFPPLGVWGTMPRVVGWDTPVPWVCVQDIGAAVANIFDNPDKWIGRDVNLAGDVQSLRNCQTVFKKVTGKKPFGVPLPAVLFRKMAGDELVEMWRWLVGWVEQIGVDALWADVEASREVCPQVHSIESWLRLSQNGS
jgi:uncharacterized protein YbjT (DUF2867 family)